MPTAIIIAGPNGAGKTTFAREFLPNEGACTQFVNADLIAAGLSPFAPETADVAAGRAMLRRLDELVSQRSDFAVETTLSGTWLLRRITHWKECGYTTILYYLQIDTPEIALQRIAQRVLDGGHDVPEGIVRRRFGRSRAKLESFKRCVDLWIVYNNSDHEPELVGSGGTDVA